MLWLLLSLELCLPDHYHTIVWIILNVKYHLLQNITHGLLFVDLYLLNLILPVNIWKLLININKLVNRTIKGHEHHFFFTIILLSFYNQNLTSVYWSMSFLLGELFMYRKFHWLCLISSAEADLGFLPWSVVIWGKCYKSLCNYYIYLWIARKWIMTDIWTKSLIILLPFKWTFYIMYQL